MRPVAPVASLGERVGPEAEELLRRQELLDRRRDFGIGIHEVEVVDDLATLVAEVALVLEASRTGHEPGNLARVNGFGGPDVLFRRAGARFARFNGHFGTLHSGTEQSGGQE